MGSQQTVTLGTALLDEAEKGWKVFEDSAASHQRTESSFDSTLRNIRETRCRSGIHHSVVMLGASQCRSMDLLISCVCSAGRSCIFVIEAITFLHWLYTSSCKMSIEQLRFVLLLSPSADKDYQGEALWWKAFTYWWLALKDLTSPRNS